MSESKLPRVTSPTRRDPLAEHTGSWSKLLSRIISIASAHGAAAEMVETGFSLRDRIVASSYGSLLLATPVRCGVFGGVGGSRSFAASQSSSANYMSIPLVISVAYDKLKELVNIPLKDSF